MNDFIANLEVRPLTSGALGIGVGGAFVRAFAFAEKEEVALQLMETELAHRELALLEVDWMVNNADVEWEQADPQQESWRVAARTQGVQMSEFHTYPAS